MPRLALAYNPPPADLDHLPAVWCRDGQPVEVDPSVEWPRSGARDAMIVVRLGVAYQACGVITLNGREYVAMFEQSMLERMEKP